MDPRIIALYDEYTHRPLDRRTFLERLAGLAGSAAAATALLPLLENNYAQAAIIAPDHPALATERVTFKGPVGDVGAYVATPKSGPAKRAGIVVIHENRGLNAHIEDIARRLATAGYTALAVDLLSTFGGTPSDEDAARAKIAQLQEDAVLRDLTAAIAYLKARPDATGKVGVIGFCWGGAMVNRLATVSADLASAAAFYGRVPPMADVPKIKASLLLHYAGNDPGVNAGIADYEAALKASGVRYQRFLYDGAEHAFHNDTNAARYNKAAAELAWTRTLAFFQVTLA